MDKVITLNAIRHYYQHEYRDTEKYLARKEKEQHLHFVDRKYDIDKALSRCLGVAMFVQECGIEYEVIEKLYMEYYNKFHKLLDTPVEI